ncbi:hypothetical protein E4405_15830, partial [Salmonella enterica subsp. enterica]|nr:hypothetical protein [Salmonella enterica subsp. enterica]
GYFNFGTGNDYSTRIARTAKKLIVEVNKYMPRDVGPIGPVFPAPAGINRNGSVLKPFRGACSPRQRG